MKKIIIEIALCLISASVLAKAPSFIGSEIVAKQSMGYGRYIIKLKPATAVGSITGFFNLCYTDDFENCISYNPNDENHLEMDVEFTPTGYNPAKRNWMKNCTDDTTCQIYHPSPEPRVDDSLSAVSFNTFPHDNQVYYQINNPYADFHTYSIDVFPNQITWSVDGTAVLTRDIDATNFIRAMPPKWATFNDLLKNNKITMVANIWDGSQGGNGGFGGGPDIIQTPGQAEIQLIAYYPATCNGNKCTIDANPSFLVDFVKHQYIQNGGPIQSGDICGSKLSDLFNFILRTDYPVYVDPKNVQCAADRLILKYSSP